MDASSRFRFPGKEECVKLGAFVRNSIGSTTGSKRGAAFNQQSYSNSHVGRNRVGSFDPSMK